MARKIIEPNIAYDDTRKLFYLTMDLGRDETAGGSGSTVRSPASPPPARPGGIF